MRRFYQRILGWALANRIVFLSIPLGLLISGGFILSNTGKEFMPALNEGTFLLMPTSLPHAGVEENKRVLQQLDMAVASIPEIETVVGKAGRTESALDPAPLSMYENIIQYKPEYMLNAAGEKQRYQVDEAGYFVLKAGGKTYNPNSTEEDEDAVNTRSFPVKAEALIEDEDGEYYRNWRPEIQSPDDIWNEIARVSKLPGVTSAPKLQPIETRLVMLQTGMRAPMGIKVKGQDLKQIEQLEYQYEIDLFQYLNNKHLCIFEISHILSSDFLSTL